MGNHGRWRRILLNRETRRRERIAGQPGFSRLFPFIPREHWADRHRRRRELALRHVEMIRTWAEFRGVRFVLLEPNSRMGFKRGRGYATWHFDKGWLNYCPDWSTHSDGPETIKVNCPEQLLSALSRLWLRE